MHALVELGDLLHYTVTCVTLCYTLSAAFDLSEDIQEDLSFASSFQHPHSVQCFLVISRSRFRKASNDPLCFLSPSLFLSHINSPNSSF